MNQKDQNWNIQDPGTGQPRTSNRPENHDNDNDNETENQGQKTVQGKNQKGPEDKVGRTAGGNEGSKGQNLRNERDQVGKGGRSVGSHKPGGDGPGTKKFKHDHDPAQPKDRQEAG